MCYDWFQQFLINEFEPVLQFSQISIRIRIRILFGNRFLLSYALNVNDAHEIQFCSTKFFQIFFFHDQDQDHEDNQDFVMKFIKRSLLSILRIPTKFDVTLQSFCENPNSFQDQERIRIMILLWISIPDLHFIHKRHPTQFCLDPLTPSKDCGSTDKVHVSTARQTHRQTDIFFCLFCLLRHTKHEHLSKGENFVFHSCYYNTFSFYILRMRWESKKSIFFLIRV